jgi:GNAT superfamily N-acetyltransferase
MRIRPANEEDVETIASIVLECDSTTSSREYELRKARDAVLLAGRRTFIGEIDGEAGGYASLDLTSPTIAELKRLFVRPGHWGIGLASALLEEAVGSAFAAGYRSMRLFTPTDNARARRFYEREGWHAAGTSVHDELGIELTEYRRALGSRRR